MLSEDGCPTGTPFGLIAPTEVLQERRCLGILHRLVLCSGVLCGWDPGSLLPPDFFCGILHGPCLCPRMMNGQDMSVLLHGPKRCSGIFRNLRRSILNGLSGPGLCLRILIRQPALESPEQGFG